GAGLGLALLLGGAGLLPATVTPPGRDLAALERQLYVAWAGQGPCDGDLTVRADRTYARRRHGPAGDDSAGTWAVRWAALPPTLVLTCTTADDPAARRPAEVKLRRLDG